MLFRSVMAKLHGMVSAFYSNKPEAERDPLINRLMIQGLTQFTVGTTNAKLLSALEFAQVNNETPQWKSLLDSVANSERVHGMPNVLLQFKTLQAPIVSFFNTVTPTVQHESQYSIDPVPATANPFPDRAYQPYPVHIPTLQRKALNRFPPQPQIGRAHV